MSSKIPHYYTNHRQAIPWLERCIYHLVMSNRAALSRNDADTIGVNKVSIAALQDLIRMHRRDRKQQRGRRLQRKEAKRLHSMKKPKTIIYAKPNLVEHQTPIAA
jgi:hypothetical protein